MPLIIPEKLKKGDTIGIVSPSAGLATFAMHRLDKAKSALEELGYKIKFAKNALKNSGYISASVEERLEDIHDMFSDKEVKMIMCAIGGNHSNQLIKHLDYGLIKNNPKIFIGYSDITVLHYAIQSQAGLSTYYGPCAMTQFGEFPKILDYTLKYFEYEVTDSGGKDTYKIEPSETWTEEFLDWFKKEDIKRPRELKKNNGYEWLSQGSAEGPALGGAILSVNHLAGTKYWLDPRGTIFFLDILKEEGLLNEAGVDSLLTDLDNMNLFDSIKGLVVSRPAGFSEEENIRIKNMVSRFVKDKKYPTLFNANVGHADPIITLRYGRVLRLNSSSGELFAA
ncbi:MAG: LD-carboxypeptidase [Patescibacteria group bacterium]|nr:LD-carboxypeptidase [Patescibacteria group bacterium]MDE2015663.1 LD-carboxypeptidase [Patescibacteria group bacterium]MDE2226720.1 LD-carboxypeptidase [Patescibacteria group bacterium]